MTFQVMLFFLFVFPCFGTAFVWVFLRKFSRSLRWTTGLSIGIAPTVLSSWLIFQGEKGGGDPDPQAFLYRSIAISLVIAVFTLVGLEFAKARSK